MIIDLLLSVLLLLLLLQPLTITAFHLKSPEFSIIKIHKYDNYIKGLEIIKFTGTKYESVLVGEKNKEEDSDSVVRMRSDVPLCLKYDDDGVLVDITTTTTAISAAATTKEECDSNIYWFPIDDSKEIGKRPSGVRGKMIRVGDDRRRVIGSIEIEW